MPGTEVSSLAMKPAPTVSLTPGKRCDVVLCDVPNWRWLSYFYGVNHVSRVLKNGELVYTR